MGNPDLGATVTDFRAILQSIDYSKFERFSNVADEISTKLLSSLLECEVLVAVTDGYYFEFSIEDAERKRWRVDSAQPAFTCSKLTIETLEKGAKYVQS